MWTYLQSFPSVLLSSALCRWGYWSASLRRAAWAHTMNAFIGRLMCGLRLSPPAVRVGIGIRLQSYPFSRLQTASWICWGNFSKSCLGMDPSGICSVFTPARAACSLSILLVIRGIVIRSESSSEYPGDEGDRDATDLWSSLSDISPRNPI